MYVLELFSGFECMSNAFREKGHYCFTVDWDKRFNSNLHKDISTLTLDDLPKEFRTPDVVFCGTDCTTYSVAAISHHRRKNPITGNLDPISEKAKKADMMNRHVKELLKTMNPKIVIWENPVGGAPEDGLYARLYKKYNHILSIWILVSKTYRFFLKHRLKIETSLQKWKFMSRKSSQRIKKWDSKNQRPGIKKCLSP